MEKDPSCPGSHQGGSRILEILSWRLSSTLKAKEILIRLIKNQRQRFCVSPPSSIRTKNKKKIKTRKRKSNKVRDRQTKFFLSFQTKIW